jgi:hypothetical protein
MNLIHSAFPRTSRLPSGIVSAALPRCFRFLTFGTYIWKRPSPGCGEVAERSKAPRFGAVHRQLCRRFESFPSPPTRLIRTIRTECDSSYFFKRRENGDHRRPRWHPRIAAVVGAVDYRRIGVALTADAASIAGDDTAAPRVGVGRRVLARCAGWRLARQCRFRLGPFD